MSDFASDYSGVNPQGLSAEQFFYRQVFGTFRENTGRRTLPFFDGDLRRTPRELSTGKIIGGENAVALEQAASRYGYKSNLWIYGDELNRLQKEVGPLYCRPGTRPVVCMTKYFEATHVNGRDLYIAEGGTGKREQYLYNLDSLDGRSAEKVGRYFGRAEAADRAYTAANLAAFRENGRKAEGRGSAAVEQARERVLAASRRGPVDLGAVTQCHYLHSLGNAIGVPEAKEDGLPRFRESCYEACERLVSMVGAGKLREHEAGRLLCAALNAGTEFARISVARDHNLENAKKVEELMVAESNRSRGYGRRAVMER